MSSLVGSVKSLFGSLFGTKRKEEPVIMIQESDMREQFEYDCDTLPMDIHTIVNRWEIMEMSSDFI